MCNSTIGFGFITSAREKTSSAACIEWFRIVPEWEKVFSKTIKSRFNIYIRCEFAFVELLHMEAFQYIWLLSLNKLLAVWVSRKYSRHLRNMRSPSFGKIKREETGVSFTFASSRLSESLEQGKYVRTIPKSRVILVSWEGTRWYPKQWRNSMRRRYPNQ